MKEREKNELFKKNLDNIPVVTNLFGEEIKMLSVKDRIGFTPLSIWQPDWQLAGRLKDIIGDDGSTRQLIGKRMKLMDSKYNVSIFNPHLAQMILSAYCPAGAKIYDPFGGGGTRGFIAAAMGYDYTGIEIRQEEVDRIKKQQDKLKYWFEIICCDSRFYKIEENSFNFSYTCPPYYNLEVYSVMNGDMSNAENYNEFLEMLEESIKTAYKGLKKDCLSVWVVGNFRDKIGSLVHFNGDLVRLGQKVGFRLHDELVFWGAAGVAASRSGQFVANRKSVRVHEYIVIFKK